MATISSDLNSLKLEDLELLTEVEEGEMALTVVGGLQIPSTRIDDCGNIVPIYFACITYPCCLGPKQIPLVNSKAAPEEA